MGRLLVGVFSSVLGAVLLSPPSDARIDQRVGSIDDDFD